MNEQISIRANRKNWKKFAKQVKKDKLTITGVLEKFIYTYMVREVPDKPKDKLESEKREQKENGTAKINSGTRD